MSVFLFFQRSTSISNVIFMKPPICMFELWLHFSVMSIYLVWPIVNRPIVQRNFSVFILAKWLMKCPCLYQAHCYSQIIGMLFSVVCGDQQRVGALDILKFLASLDCRHSFIKLSLLVRQDFISQPTQSSFSPSQTH